MHGDPGAASQDDVIFLAVRYVARKYRVILPLGLRGCIRTSS